MGECRVSLRCLTRLAYLRRLTVLVWARCLATAGDVFPSSLFEASPSVVSAALTVSCRSQCVSKKRQRRNRTCGDSLQFA